MIRIFGAFVKKEYLHIIRDTRTLVILFGIPVALVIIFGYTVTNEFKNASIAVIDQSQDELSKAFVEHLTTSGHLQLVALPADLKMLEAAFRSGEVKMGVVIPDQFERNFYQNHLANVQLITDASEPNYSTTLISYATQMIIAFQKEYAEEQQPSYQINVQTRMLYNPRLVGAFTFIPGVVALILLLISAMITSLTIAKEKETGTMDLLLVSPLPPLLIILGKVTPYVLLSFINALMVFGMGYYIFEVPIRGSLGLLLSLCLLYLMVSLALGIFISTKAATQQAAMMSSLFALMMPTVLLSGFMFPIASMPLFLQYVSKIIPAHYFIDIQKAIMLKGAGMEAIIYPTLVLSGMLIALLFAAWKSFKVRYK